MTPKKGKKTIVKREPDGLSYHLIDGLNLKENGKERTKERDRELTVVAGSTLISSQGQVNPVVVGFGEIGQTQFQFEGRRAEAGVRLEAGDQGISDTEKGGIFYIGAPKKLKNRTMTPVRLCARDSNGAMRCSARQ